MEKLIVEQEFLEDEEDREYTKEFIEKNKIEVERDLLERSGINIYSDMIRYLENVGLFGEVCTKLSIQKIINFLMDIKSS